MTRQHIVFLTGAGISVESGLSTFRGKNGMWTNEEWAYLASTEALYNDTQRCLVFYNFRRKQLADVEPNDAHRMIAELEKEHQVTVITQNVDNLHERAGSSIFVVIGTSLKVYPAAGFINHAHHEVPEFVIDPGEMIQCVELGFTHFKTSAVEGMKMLLDAFKQL